MSWIVKDGDWYADEHDVLWTLQCRAERFGHRWMAEAVAGHFPHGRVVKLVPKTADYVCFIPAWGYVTQLRPTAHCPYDTRCEHDSEKALVFDKEAADILSEGWNKWANENCGRVENTQYMSVLPC